MVFLKNAALQLFAHVKLVQVTRRIHHKGPCSIKHRVQMTFTYGLWSLRVQVSQYQMGLSIMAKEWSSFRFKSGLTLDLHHIYDKYLEQLLDLLAITFWRKNPSIPFYGFQIICIQDGPEIVKRVYKKLSVVTTCMWKSWSFSSYTIKTKEEKT